MPKVKPIATIKRRFEEENCVGIDYEFRVALEKFRVKRFTKAFLGKGGEFPEEATLFTATCGTKHRNDNDYHVHFGWYVSKRDFHASVDYVEGVFKPTPGEREPLAENVMQWLGTFFKSSEVSANVHGSFRYSTKEWQAVLPIPMIMPVSRRKHVEVDGMSVVMPARAYGVESGLVTADEKWIRISLTGKRKVAFNNFSIDYELSDLSAAARMLVQETGT